MSQITITDDLAARLADATQPVEIFDEQGRRLGEFRSEAYRRLVRDALAACPVGDEELRRRREQDGGRELKTILADLERRAS